MQHVHVQDFCVQKDLVIIFMKILLHYKAINYSGFKTQVFLVGNLDSRQ